MKYLSTRTHQYYIVSSVLFLSSTGSDEKDSWVIESGKITGVKIGGADTVTPFKSGGGTFTVDVYSRTNGGGNWVWVGYVVRNSSGTILASYNMNSNYTTAGERMDSVGPSQLASWNTTRHVASTITI